MSRYGTRTALALSIWAILVTGCGMPEQRMDAAASRDDTRRAQFEHCRDQGRTDCDELLNAPVSADGDAPRHSVRERERRLAYDRCVDKGGSDCDDLLHHD